MRENADKPEMNQAAPPHNTVTKNDSNKDSLIYYEYC